MKKIASLIAVIIAFSCATTSQLNARVVKSYYCDDRNSSGAMEFVVDSVDLRTDLTRVYGKLKGTPHTSHRIDSIKMELVDACILPSTDIDGVDMTRWFQWEDDGLIPVEIDFPPLKKAPNTFFIITTGPKGECTWSFINGKVFPKSKR